MQGRGKGSFVFCFGAQGYRGAKEYAAPWVWLYIWRTLRNASWSKDTPPGRAYTALIFHMLVLASGFSFWKLVVRGVSNRRLSDSRSLRPSPSSKCQGRKRTDLQV